MSDRKILLPQFTLEGGMLAGLENLSRELRQTPRKYKAALVIILNRTMKSGVTLISGEVIKRYRVKKTDVMDHIKTRKARGGRANRYYTIMRIKASPSAHMTDFEAKQIKSGVSVTKRRGKGSRFVVKGAFIAPGKDSGKLIVFKRVGRERYPIEALYTTTEFDFLKGRAMRKHYRDAMSLRLYKEAEHEISRRLQGIGKQYV